MKPEEIVVLELAGETAASAFGSGVNKALAETAEKIVEIREEVAKLRQFAARVVMSEEGAYDMEKFSVQSFTNGGDVTDGADYTWTTVDNQALVQFLDASAQSISYGVKLTRKVVDQARRDPVAFLRFYRDSMARALAAREDVYIADMLGSAPESDSSQVVYGGDATSIATIEAADTFTVEKYERMLDLFKEQSDNDPSDLILPTRLAGQLRRDARLFNSTDYHLAIKEDGTSVTQIGDVVVHEIRGTAIINTEVNGSSVEWLDAFLLNRGGAFGIVEFQPVEFYAAEPDPLTAGNNYHRMGVSERLQAKVLDAEQLVVGRFAKNTL